MSLHLPVIPHLVGAGRAGLGVYFFANIFLFFFTFICLPQPSAAFICLYWRGSEKGVWRGF
jgi:hypothetical protein